MMHFLGLLFSSPSLLIVSLPIKGRNPIWFHLTRQLVHLFRQSREGKGTCFNESLVREFWTSPHLTGQINIHQLSSMWLCLSDWETGSIFCHFSLRQSPDSIHITEDVPKAQRASISQWCGFAGRKMTLKGKGRLSWYCHNKSTIWKKSYIPNPLTDFASLCGAGMSSCYVAVADLAMLILQPYTELHYPCWRKILTQKNMLDNYCKKQATFSYKQRWSGSTFKSLTWNKLPVREGPQTLRRG